MKEYPILFRPELVRKILDGKKTQTRRPVRGVPTCIHLGKWIMDWGLSGVYGDADGRFWLDVQTDVDDCSHTEIKCPFGTVGDVLWVRETWQRLSNGDPESEKTWEGVRDDVFYLADESDFRNKPMSGRWRPSIHMPRWACRLFLEITGVRVERIQDISHRDALAEGVDYDVSEVRGAPIRRFHSAWNKVYPGSWDRNDWVWVVSFKKNEAPQ